MRNVDKIWATDIINTSTVIATREAILHKVYQTNESYYLVSMYKGGAVYITSSPNRTTLYTGVTSDLYKRIYGHRHKMYPDSFTARYNCVMLVYYRGFDRIEEAIAEEKRIKGSSRRHKEQLINAMNPEWKDLWHELECW